MSVSHATRQRRAIAVLNHLLPLVTERGISYGPAATRWVAPPFSVLLRSPATRTRLGGASHTLEVWCGSKTFSAEWTDAGSLRIGYMRQADGWDCLVLALR